MRDLLTFALFLGMMVSAIEFGRAVLAYFGEEKEEK